MALSAYVMLLFVFLPWHSIGTTFYTDTFKTGTETSLSTRNLTFIGTPNRIKSATFIVNNMCNNTLQLTKSELESYLFKDVQNVSVPFVVEEFFESCSRGRTLFRRENNVVFDNISLSCQNNETISTCSHDEITRWALIIENKARKIKRFSLGNYKHRIFVFPRHPNCTFVAVASQACKQPCRVWVNGMLPPEAQAPILVHELGHNLGLFHSSSQSNEYGDGSCVMGSSYTSCFNAIQQWRLNWTKPVDVIDAWNMRNGTNTTYILSGLLEAERTFVLVNIDRQRKSYYSISYRRAKGDGVESGLDDMFKGRVSVHRANVRSNTYLVSNKSLDVGEQLALDDIGIVVLFESISVEKAVIVMSK